MIDLLVILFTTFFFIYLAHWKIGIYPPVLPKTKNLRLELLEAIIVWGVMLISVTHLMLSRYFFFDYYPFVIIGRRLIPIPHLYLMFVFPLFLEVVINRRRGVDFGFTIPISWSPALALFVFGTLSGIISFVFESPSPYSLDYLMLGLFTPALSEEWVYRSVIQQKLERVLGQQKAWIISGLLYGLIHVPTNFFGTLWVTSSKDPVVAVLKLACQCAFGWLWGILFIKNRSIYPVIISHYLTNYFAGMLAYLIE